MAERWISQGYAASLVLDLVGLAPSTYYTSMQRRQHSQEKPVNDGRGRKPTMHSKTTSGRLVPNEQIKEWLCESIAGDGFAYGYHKLTTELQDEYQLVINHKKVYRLCKELGILRKRRPVRAKPKNVASKPAKATKSNELWEIDVKYGYINGTGQFFFQASLIDVKDRCVIDYHLGLSCKAVDAVQLVKNALKQRNPDTAPVIRTDNGPQFTANAFAKACDQLRIEHELIPPRTPNMNAHIEAFHSILADECYERHDFENFAHVYKVVSEYMTFYNERRRHGSLRNRAPERYYREQAEKQRLSQYPTVVEAPAAS